MKKVDLETPSETRERCASTGAEWIGDKVEFAPVGGLQSRTRVAAVFDAHGFGDAIPRDSRPVSLLKKAGKQGANPAGLITREFVSPLPDTPTALHVTRVKGSGEGGDDFACLARIRLEYRPDPVTGDAVQVAVALPPDGQTEFADRAAAERAQWVAARYNVLTSDLDNSDMGKWTRDALESVGCAKSIGGGNNYFVATSVADRVHALLVALRDGCGIYYLRCPQTTAGARHERAAMAQACEVSLASQVNELRDHLKAEVAASADPDARKRGATLARRIEAASEIKNRLAMFRAVLDASVAGPLAKTAELFRQHFSTLADGGKGSAAWFEDEPEAPAATPPAPASEPEPSRKGGSGSGEDDGGITMAAAPAGNADAWWC